MPEKIFKVYLASPYGFTDSGRYFMEKHVIPTLKKHSLEILNPWEYSNILSKRTEEISSKRIEKQIDLWKNLNKDIASSNENMIKKSEIVIAVLDGSDLDSGVAVEIGIGYALGKMIIGYRSDFRIMGDNVGAKVNLQVEYSIYNSGGEIVTNLVDLERSLEKAMMSLRKGS